MDYQLSMKPLEAGGTCIVDYDPEIHENMEKSILDDFWEVCVKVNEDE